MNAQPHPMEVEFRAISEVIPYARNARTRSKQQIAQLVASMKQFGWTIPMLIAEDGTVIAGHGRLMAAQQLGNDTVPVIVARGWSDEQRRAYTLLDNKLAEKSGWDEELLALELADLKSLKFDMPFTGFGEGEIERLLSNRRAGQSDPDAVPETPVDPITRLGDLYTLGDHRLLCGDSTNPAAVARLLGDAKPILMVTDPPYGVEYDANWRNEALRSNGKPIGGRAIGKVRNDDRADWREAWALFPGDVAYVWHGGVAANAVADSLIAAGLLIRSQIIWAKNNIAIGRGNYHWQHEPCWYAVRKDGKSGWNGDRKQSTLWMIDKPQKSETGHSTQKPVECMLRPIENNSVEGAEIYEPFSGSGTTLIACEQLQRRCFAMEISPAYCDVTVERWQNFTGKKAICERPKT